MSEVQGPGRVAGEPPAPASAPAAPGAVARPGAMARLDAWMASHPWHPRVAPFVAYVGMLAVVQFASEHWPNSYPALYVLQLALTVFFLFRYRRLLPELTMTFDWLAVPVGVGVVIAWIALGKAMVRMSPGWFADIKPIYLANIHPWLLPATLVVRLMGMSLVVPPCEELFIRSLLLRSFNKLHRTGIGAFQLLQDLPVLGDWLMHTKLGTKAGRHPPIFGDEFLQAPLGRLSVFGVASSTLIFMLFHAMRDWPGAVFCGVAYCLLLAATARKGLGPVIWAHGITNALLWAYSIKTGDWQFL